ncbi:MAG: SDR family NAD(P)-dependent oxidoreductase [Saprospiraceae bacterium]|nr:SDR family NAD(P)-dependent oxidoreductase [Saprospiraceae bacterium]
MKNVLITGVNSGIGLYLATELAESGFKVFGTLRDLSKAPPELSKFPNLHLLEMQLNRPDGIENAFLQIKPALEEAGLYALINNAGTVEPGPSLFLPMESFREVFEINVFAPLRLTQLCFGALSKYGPGARIIQMSSVSGLFASPFLGAYASSKFALEGLSDSMRRELNLLGIHVVKLNPGSLKTGIWRKQLDVHKKFPPNPFDAFLEKANELIFKMERKAIPVDALQAAFWDAFMSDHPKPSYLVHPNKFMFRLISRFLPVNFVDRMIRKTLKSSKNEIRPF